MIIKLDIRETELELAFATACGLDKSYNNITIEKENLPIGDIIIYTDEGKELAIIERKTLQDLAASIRDGRYNEQSYRLNNCKLHNHAIYYLIEGDINRFRPSKYGKNPVTKKALMSAMTSISFFKGFSLLRTNNVNETAETILQMTDKISRTTKGSFFYANDDNSTDSNYLAVSKRVKKDNITKDNIGAIMISQIPGVSTNSASAIMDKYKTLDALILAMKKDHNSLREIVTKTKTGKSRKLSKRCTANIYNFLLGNIVQEINVN
jgi:ERCC4-type nuclease